MNKRFCEVDTARGLAMLVIVGWHLFDFHTPWTDGWTMPIFFIIMGVFYKQESSFIDLITKKFKAIVVPLLFYSMPAFFLILYKYDYLFLIKKIFNPYECIHTGNWFLICILWCYIINYLIHKFISNKEIIFLTQFLLSGFTYIISHLHLFGYRIVLPLFISTAMGCTIFIGIGEM